MAVVAVSVGVIAVITVGDSIRDRGPLGNEVARNAELEEGAAVIDPEAPAVQDTIDGEFGRFEVECRGVTAIGLAAEADRAAGWRTVSYEQGPDDDVDAVFANRRRSVEIEVFCNRGRPTVSDEEWKTLPEED